MIAGRDLVMVGCARSNSIATPIGVNGLHQTGYDLVRGDHRRRNLEAKAAPKAAPKAASSSGQQGPAQPTQTASQQSQPSTPMPARQPPHHAQDTAAASSTAAIGKAAIVAAEEVQGIGMHGA